MLLLQLFLCFNLLASPTKTVISAPLSTYNTIQAEPVPEYYHDDVSPGMLFFLVIGGLIVFAGLGVGIAVTLVAVFLFVGLISMGIVSTSLLVGFYNRSFSKGFKIFIVLCSVTVGAIAGGGLGWLLNYLFEWGSAPTAVAVGLLAGIISGIIFGFVANYIFKKLALYIRTKFAARFPSPEATPPTYSTLPLKD